MKLRIGVIGAGFGKQHIAGFQQHPDCDVTALCARSHERLDPAAEKFGVPGRYLSINEMLDKETLDIVSVAGPNKCHRDMVVQALEAGCHVLCEKPPAMNTAQTLEMIQAADKAGKRLMFNFSYRFGEASRKLREQVDAGRLGDIYFGRTMWHRRRGVPWWYDRDGTGMKDLNGGGPLVDLGVHRMDLALWLMDYPKPVWVMGATYNRLGLELAKKEGKNLDVEDMGNALVRFENGASLAIEASWAANVQDKEWQETLLLGTRAGLVQKNVDNSYAYDAEIYTEKDGEPEDLIFQCSQNKKDSKLCAMFHFADAIVNDTPHMCTGAEGLILMQILDAIYESAEKGEPVRIANAERRMLSAECQE